MHFGEYELSPSLISLSPLPSAHPEAFQRLLVRSSSWCYPAFNLAKGRSLGFASATADYTPYSDSLSLRIRVSSHLTLPAKATRRFIMQKARRHCFKQLRPLVGARFQELFHSSVRSAFHLSLTVLVRYRSLGEYLALPDGPGRFTQNSSCSALLRILLCFDNIRIRNCHALWSFFPESSSPMSSCNDVVLQPRSCRNMNGLGYSPFARHYWGNHCYFLFLQVLRCFSSLR